MQSNHANLAIGDINRGSLRGSGVKFKTDRLSINRVGQRNFSKEPSIPRIEKVVQKDEPVSKKKIKDLRTKLNESLMRLIVVGADNERLSMRLQEVAKNRSIFNESQNYESSAMRSEIIKLQQTLEDKKREILILNDKLKRNEGDFKVQTDIQGRLAILGKENSRLQSSNLQKIGEVNILKKEVDGLKIEVNSRNNAVEREERLKKEMEMVSSELSNMQNKLHQLQIGKSNQDGAVEQLRQSLDQIGSKSRQQEIENKALNEKLRLLQEMLSSKNSELDILKDKINGMSNQLELQDKQLARVDELSIENEKLKSMLNNEKGSLDGFRSQLDSLKNIISTKEDLIEEQDHQNKELIAKVEYYEKEMQKIGELLNDSMSEKQNLIFELEQNKIQFENERKKYKEYIEEMKNDLRKISKKIESERKVHNNSIKILESERKNKIAELEETEKKKNLDTQTLLRQELAALEAAYHEHKSQTQKKVQLLNKTITDYEGQINSAKKKIDNLVNEKDKFLIELKEATNNLQSIKLEMIALDKLRETLQQSKNTLLGENNQLKEILSNIENKAKLSENENNILQSKIKTLNIKNDSKGQDLDMILQEKDLLDRKYRNIMKERDQISQDLSEMLKEKNVIEEELMCLQEQNKKLANEINDIVDKERQTQQNLDISKDEIQLLTEKLEKTIQLNSSIENEVLNVKNSMIDLNKEKNDLFLQLENTNEEKTKLLDKISLLTSNLQNTEIINSDLSEKLKDSINERDILQSESNDLKLLQQDSLNQNNKQNDELSRKISIIEDSKSKINLQNQQISLILNEKEELLTLKNQIIEQRDNTLNNLERVRTELQETLKQNQDLSNELQKLHDEKNNLFQDIKVINAENSDLKQQRIILSNQLKQIHSDKIGVDERLKNILQESNNQEKDISKLMQLEKDLQEKYDKNQLELENMIKTKQNQLIRIDELETQESIMMEENKRLKQDLQKYQDSKAIFEDEYQKLSKDNITVKEVLSELQKEQDLSQNKNNQLINQTNELQKNLQILNEKLETLRDLHNNLTVSYDNLEDEKRNLLNQKDQIESEYSKLKALYDNLSVHNSDLKQNLTIETKNNLKLNEEMSSLTDERKQGLQSIAELKKIIHSIKTSSSSEKESLSNCLTEHQNKIFQLESEISKMREGILLKETSASGLKLELESAFKKIECINLENKQAAIKVSKFEPAFLKLPDIEAENEEQRKTLLFKDQELESLSRNCDGLIKEMENEKQLNKELSVQIQSLQNEKHNLESGILQLKDEIQSTKELISTEREQYEKEYSSLETIIEDLEKRLQDADNHIENINQELKKNNQEINLQNNQKDELLAQFDNIVGDKTKIEDHMHKLQLEFDDINTQNEKLIKQEKQFKMKLNELENLKDQFNKSKSRNEELMDLVNRNKVEINAMKSQNRISIADLERAKEQIKSFQSLEQKLRQKERQANDFEEQNHRMKSMLEESQRKLAQFKNNSSNIEDLQQRNKQMIQDIDFMQNQIESIQQEAEKWRKKYIRVEKKAFEQEEQLRELENTQEEALRQAIRSQNSNTDNHSSLEIEVSRLEKAVSKKSKDLDSTVLELKEIKEDMDSNIKNQIKVKTDKFQYELNSLKSSFDNVNKKNAELKVEIQDLTKEFSSKKQSMENQIKQLQSRFKSIPSDTNDNNLENEHQRKEIYNLNESIKTLQIKIKSSNNNIEKLDEKLIKYQSIEKKLIKENKRYLEELDLVKKDRDKIQSKIIDDNPTRITDKKQSLDEFNTQKASLEAKIYSLENEVSSLNMMINTHEKQKDGNIESYQQTIDEMHQDIQVLAAENGNLDNILQGKDRQITKLHQSIKELKDELKPTQNNYIRARDKAEISVKEAQKFKLRLQEALNKISELEEVRTNLESLTNTQPTLMEKGGGSGDIRMQMRLFFALSELERLSTLVEKGRV